MRFQTTETVPTADTEKVLHALEASLREFSEKVERKGPRITLYGLGPSPRARNYRDTAVFDVTTKGSATTIRADVTFQASALLGASGQDAVVRSKLDYAFDQIRVQLGLPEPGRQGVQQPVVHAAFVEPQPPEAEHDFEDSVPVIDDELRATEYAAKESTMWSSPPPAAPEEIPDDAEEVSGEPEPAPSNAPPPITPFSVWAASLRSVKVPPKPGDSGVQQSAVEEEREPQSPTLKLAAEAHKTNLPILLAVLLGTVVAAGSVYLYWVGLLSRMPLRFAHPKATAPAPQPQPAPPPVVQVPAPPPPPRHEEAEPKVWLEQWADAMRSRDAELQASFYADPVVRYLDDTNVSKEALTTFFRSQIQARNDLWTMKLEKVSIEPLTSSHVIARLSKHFMEIEDNADASEKQIADRYVRSRLELRRINGEWKIVSEQDVTPAGGTR